MHKKFFCSFLIFFSLFLITTPVFSRHIAVFAPHPDDESISLGGMIADLAASGAVIHGIILTDGEAYTRAVRANRLSRKPVLSSFDYAKLGKIRRQEAASAMNYLGILPENQYFLAYPGNTINKLYRSQNNRLIRSAATKRRYAIACWQGQKKDVAFTRKNLADDIDALLKKINPDTIIMPVIFDTNSDHHATANLLLERINYLNLKPEILQYLVHQHSKRIYPKPYGYLPEAGIDNPEGFLPPLRYFPSQSALLKKENALKAHKTQINLKDGFLLSFIRKEEIYWKPDQ